MLASPAVPPWIQVPMSTRLCSIEAFAMFRDSGRTFARRRASIFTEKFEREITLCCKYVITQGNFVAGRQGFVPTRNEPTASCGAPEELTSSHGGAKRVKWLGGRDSNPDNVVQSHVSYR